MNEIKIGDIGVCLSDHDETGNLYMVDALWGNDGLTIVKVDDHRIEKRIYESEFWALTSVILPI